MKSSLIQFILALVVCATTIAGYWFWYATIANKSVAVADLQSQIDAKTKTANRITTTRAALAEISGDESGVQNYFVSETGVVAFINGLEDLGHSLGATVSVLSVSAGGVPIQPTFELALSVKGTFDAVVRTIGAIEYLPYDISMSTLSVGQDAKNNWSANLKLAVGSSITSATTSTP